MTNRSTPPSRPGRSSPPVLRLLGPIGVTGSARALSSQQLSLIAFLDGFGPAPPDVLAEALWDGAPISERRLINLVSSVRSALGPDHLPDRGETGYRLIGLPSDLDLLDRIGSTTGAGEPGSDHELAALEAALALVRGPVMRRPGPRHWRWLDDHPEVVARAEAVVGARTARLVELYRRCGQLDRARIACERILRVQPLDGQLIGALEAIHRDQGRPAAAHRLVIGWRRRVADLTGQDPLSVPGQASMGSAVTTTLP